MADFPRGRFCWHELLTSDTAAAKAFYTMVVGWGTMDWERDASYTMWTASGVPVGGFMVMPDNVRAMRVPPNWLTYVAVEDAGGTVMRATMLGGTTLREPEVIPHVGTFALLRDPQGAVIAVLQPAGEAAGHDGESRPGEFSWHELATTDWDSAWSFYQALFGWQKMDTHDMGELGTYFVFGRLGRELGGIYNKPAEMPAPPNWLPYVRVSNADRAVQLVKQAGGTVINGPMDVPGGDRVAVILDPQGAAFAVHEEATVERSGRAAVTPKPAVKKPAVKKPAAKKLAAKKPATKKKIAKKITKKGTKKRATRKKATKKTGRKKKR